MTSRTYLKQAVAVLIAVLVPLGGYSLWAARTETPSPPRDFARMVAAYELQLCHWEMCETDPQFRTLMTQFTPELKPELEYEWSTQFVSTSKSGQTEGEKKPSDKFEVAAIAELKKAGDEVWQQLPDGSFRYVTAIAKKESCTACHLGEGAQPQADELLGYSSITFTRRVAE
jgi:hypothetical protein